MVTVGRTWKWAFRHLISGCVYHSLAMWALVMHLTSVKTHLQYPSLKWMLAVVLLVQVLYNSSWCILLKTILPDSGYPAEGKALHCFKRTLGSIMFGVRERIHVSKPCVRLSMKSCCCLLTLGCGCRQRTHCPCNFPTTTCFVAWNKTVLFYNFLLVLSDLWSRAP